MGGDLMLQDNISFENIENRNKILRADNEKNKHFPQKLANELSKDIVFDQVFDFGGNKNALEEDFIFVHSTVEGRSETITYFYQT